MRYNISQYLAVVIMVFTACQSGKKDLYEVSVQQLLPDAQAVVTVAPLETVSFEYELVSNGKISARSVAEVRFHTTEVIKSVLVKNGDRVSKGQQLALLDTYTLKNNLDQARDALDRSRLEMQDVLIGQGYRLDSIDSVPDEVLQLARVKSGYNTANTNFELASYNFERATITAPIDGVVANLFVKPQSISSPSEVFCNIIDTGTLEVDFTVLENELGMIKIGDRVTVTPFSIPGLEIEGRVSEINPWVDNNGMVKIKASVNYHQRLVEGMNARVSVFRQTGEHWVIPKSAVVLRSGREVVFTFVDGKAVWNYIETGLENATQYTITGETLNEGDLIITSGNINLAHESPITVID